MRSFNVNKKYLPILPGLALCAVLSNTNASLSINMMLT
uniref:Uncharacterized protein n=1 Tax=Escherichia coli TaxID=562 RepID=A0A6D1NY24_ECOLX|nr:hypothetical protein [Escherichia coli]